MLILGKYGGNYEGRSGWDFLGERTDATKLPMHARDKHQSVVCLS